MVKEKSEFGKGLSYCLALFLCHSERVEMYTPEMAKKLGYSDEHIEKRNAEMWFNGASDHLYDLEIPDKLTISLQNRLKEFQEKVLAWGHGLQSNATKEDKEWAIFEAKNLIRLIDKFHGIKTEKGQWQ